MPITFPTLKKKNTVQRLPPAVKEKFLVRVVFFSSALQFRRHRDYFRRPSRCYFLKRNRRRLNNRFFTYRVFSLPIPRTEEITYLNFSIEIYVAFWHPNEVLHLLRASLSVNVHRVDRRPTVVSCKWQLLNQAIDDIQWYVKYQLTSWTTYMCILPSSSLSLSSSMTSSSPSSFSSLSRSRSFSSSLPHSDSDSSASFSKKSLATFLS